MGEGLPWLVTAAFYFYFLSVCWGLRAPWAIWPEGLKFLLFLMYE